MGANKIKYSIFTWEFGKYKKIIAHSENYLPELEIQGRFCNFSGFCNIVGSISIDYTFTFAFASMCTKEYPNPSKPMYFTPEAEYEVVREAFSHKLDIPLVNPSKVWRDSTQNKAPTSSLQIGDSLR